MVYSRASVKIKKTKRNRRNKQKNKGNPKKIHNPFSADEIPHLEGKRRRIKEPDEPNPDIKNSG